MSLTMYGSSSRGNPPSFETRTSGVSGSSRTTRNYTMGTSGSTSSVAPKTIHSTTYSSSYGSSNRFSSTRKLPKGPGPLPDRFNLDRNGSFSTNGELRFVSPYRKSDDHYPRTTGYSPAKPSSIQKNTIERKVSNDSGYGSSSSFKNRYDSLSSSSSLAGRRSKSYSSLDPSFAELSIKDEPSTSTTSYSSKTVTNRTGYGHRMSSRTNTLENIPKLDENHNIYTSSRYSSESESSKRSTINNNYSSTTNKITSPTSTLNASTSPKNRNVILDYNENRKEIISATSTSLRRNSKSSTSSSSPSTPNGRGCTDGLVGLRNLGNTCFMNSILQCLSQSFVLTDYMLKGLYMKQINSKSSMKGKLIQAYAELIKSMWKPSNSETAISPHSFKTQIQRFAPRFVGYNQQDAQEFLRFLLEGLHDDLNTVHDKPKYKVCEFSDSLSDNEKAEMSWKHYLARDNSRITDLFVGQLKSTLKCTECGHKSVTFDPFWDLSLPIPRKSSSSSYGSYDNKNITIQSCMELFTKEEVLDGDERPTCEKCRKKRKSTKKFTIQRFPQILVLHLKRFSGFGFRSKLQTTVEFPTDSKLDLKQFASDSTESRAAMYSLYAVSNHSGTTYGGHYTAYCKHPFSHDWHCFNDSSVDNIPSSRIGGPQAYILFYNRVDTISSL